MTRYGWARYSGFFFYSYTSNKGKNLEGPFPTRQDAYEAKMCWPAGTTGKVFQKERPVMQ